MTTLPAAPALLATVTQVLLGLCCVCAPGECEECEHHRESASCSLESELPHLCGAGHDHARDCQFHSGAFVAPEQSLRWSLELNPLAWALPIDSGFAGQLPGILRYDHILGSSRCGIRQVSLYLQLGVLLV